LTFDGKKSNLRYKTVRAKKFFSEALTEIRRVNWPSRRESVKMVLVVIGFSLAVAAFLGFFDFLFVNFIKTIVK
jgi:preprotein translocase SecE subunit